MGSENTTSYPHTDEIDSDIDSDIGVLTDAPKPKPFIPIMQFDLPIGESNLKCGADREKLICKSTSIPDRKLFINFGPDGNLIDFIESMGDTIEYGIQFDLDKIKRISGSFDFNDDSLAVSFGIDDKKFEIFSDVIDEERNFFSGTINIDGTKFKCVYDESKSKDLICDFYKS